jgi:hypothetical protein
MRKGKDVKKWRTAVPRGVGPVWFRVLTEPEEHWTAHDNPPGAMRLQIYEPGDVEVRDIRGVFVLSKEQFEARYVEEPEKFDKYGPT